MNALTDNDVRDSAPVWTPDGQILYISEGEGYAAIRQMEADGGGDELIYDGSGYESTVSAHPDGGLLIFTSAETGRDELYVYASGGRYIQQLTSNGAAAARWVRGASDIGTNISGVCSCRNPRGHSGRQVPERGTPD
ncbi:MAG: PD40 domain-containing protein [Chloroflexi bacterium]|uniref:TolB family protein n=1 Tax=Candidatus Flexifilum breve TaxID=3140694 RepID=UPI00313577C1|nr:PD40 domain-containing protein [Chloroflexota bacterium]